MDVSRVSSLYSNGVIELVIVSIFYLLCRHLDFEEKGERRKGRRLGVRVVETVDIQVALELYTFIYKGI